MPAFTSKWGIKPPSDLSFGTSTGDHGRADLVVLRQQLIANMKEDQWGAVTIQWKVSKDADETRKNRLSSIRAYQQAVMAFNKQPDMLRAGLQIHTQIYQKSESSVGEEATVDMYMHFTPRDK